MAKSYLISANILAMSPNGELALNYKAMVSNNFFPKETYSTYFNWVKTLNPALLDFCKNTALEQTMFIMTNNANNFYILDNNSIFF